MKNHSYSRTAQIAIVKSKKKISWKNKKSILNHFSLKEIIDFESQIWCCINCTEKRYYLCEDCEKLHSEQKIHSNQHLFFCLPFPLRSEIKLYALDASVYKISKKTKKIKNQGKKKNILWYNFKNKKKKKN